MSKVCSSHWKSVSAKPKERERISCPIIPGHMVKPENLDAHIQLCKKNNRAKLRIERMKPVVNITVPEAAVRVISAEELAELQSSPDWLPACLTDSNQAGEFRRDQPEEESSANKKKQHSSGDDRQ